MKAAESLFEFMPYGAPELLQSRRERLASSLLASSLFIAALFVAAGVGYSLRPSSDLQFLPGRSGQSVSTVSLPRWPFRAPAQASVQTWSA